MAKYTLPVATENILGGVKIGEGINATQDGVISIKDYGKMKEDISALSESVEQGKSLVATSITTKGVSTSSTDSFKSSYLTKTLLNISSGVTTTILSPLNAALFVISPIMLCVPIVMLLRTIFTRTMALIIKFSVRFAVIHRLAIRKSLRLLQ